MKRHTKTALAKELSISQYTLSQYENGKKIPTTSFVIKASNVLGQSVDYFFRPHTIELSSVKFRKKASLNNGAIDSIKLKTVDFVERYLCIEKICSQENNFNPLSISPVNDKSSIASVVQNIRDEWSLGVGGIANITSLFENHGIKVFDMIIKDKFDGMESLLSQNTFVVIINRIGNSERERFTLLHELGHLLLKFDNSVSDKEQEKLCNFFASEMLISASVFKQIFGSSRHDISYCELQSIQKDYGISCDALMYKARDLGIISEKRYEYYCIKKNKDKDFKARVEKSHYRQESATRFSNLVYQALNDGLVTMSYAASLLNTSIAKVKEGGILV